MTVNANRPEPDAFATIASGVVESESELAALAGGLAELCRAGDLVCLFGDLGAGKTSFARGFIRALTHPGAEVPSPTFTLAQVYSAGESAHSAEIWHLDLYRLSAAEEIWELGVEEAFSEAIVLIEWPERAIGVLPVKRLEIHLGFCDKSTDRSVTLKGDAEWAGRVRGRLTERLS
jgi:tRNA threonylcarbamoyladenosine biosynthesis protein TsaE